MKARPRFSHSLDRALVRPTATLEDALTAVNASGLLLCCVVNDQMNLMGILTDSDIRRAVLKHASLTVGVDSVCNKSPLTCGEDLSEASLFEIARETGKREIPLLDETGKLVDVFVLGLNDSRTDVAVRVTHSHVENEPVDADMFLLAGGLGTRLRAVVSDRPKPLAKVGNAPIIEHLLGHAFACGLRKFFVSINYKGEMIEQHLGLPQFERLAIEFVKEPSRLGTAGSLKLVAAKVHRNVLVCNADLLTNIPFHKVVEAHVKSGAALTTVVRTYKLSVPYGVVEVSSDQVTAVREKPELSFLISAGIYVLSPQVLELIGDSEVLDMPELISRCISAGLQVQPFLMHEYWLDVGKPDDFHKANEMVGRLFGSDVNSGGINDIREAPCSEANKS